MSVYVYDMGGTASASPRGWNDPYLFDLDGYWIGHCAWDDNDVVGRDGGYLGSIVSDRLVRRNDWCERACPTVGEDPGHAVPTSAPSTPMAFPNRFAYEDVRLGHPA
jgi:hypothetical protein